MRIRISEELNNATFLINNLVEDQVLDTQKSSVLSRAVFGNFKLIKGYLIIAISGRDKIDNITKWKLTLNNIALTREFKPHLESKTSEKAYQALFVYDVSKILNTAQSEALFKMKYEGKEPVTVNVVSLITFHQYIESSVRISCTAEILNLNNHYILDLSPYATTQKYKECILYLGIVSERNSRLKLINSDNNSFTVHNLGKGLNFIETSLQDTKTSKLILEGEDLSARHIFHCVAYTTLEYPSIAIKQFSVTNNGLELILINEGSASADECEIIVFKTGVPMQKISLGLFNASEERSIKIPLPNKINGKIVIRLIWRKALKTFTRDQIIESK
jgi:hypothetical protein